MRGAFRFAWWMALFALVLLGTRDASAELPGAGGDVGNTVLYRDTWGVPHIYAPTAEQGLYAMGWAQAQDRPTQLLENFARALGESAKFEGARAVPADARTHLFAHYETAQRNLDRLDGRVRSHLRAFAQGINDFYAAYPDDRPAWWGDRAVDEAMIIAFSRLFLYNWSIDDAYSDLQRGGIRPGVDREQRGSNQFAISPQRSAVDAPMLYIDPHLSWWGPSRFWEVRMHAGELVGSGFTLPGSPYIGLGHNAQVAWAMTTGGPDTADVYELTLKEDEPNKYSYDGEWRELTSREVEIAVKDGDPQRVTLYTSHLGPIIAQKDNKAYAAAMAYQDVVELNQAWYGINTAKDYKDIEQALSHLVMFPQNIMVADSAGNIYYQRTGRVPVRPEGYDWSKPVPGDTSKTAWKGLHPSSDLVQVLNPEQGYMQNCNIPPDQMMVNSPMTPDKFPDYIFSDLSHGPRGGWSNQRGARAVQLLDADDSVTVEEALQYAVDLHPYGVERWIDALRKAHETHGAGFADRAGYTEGIQDLLNWDQRLAADSTGALKYYYWRDQLVQDYGDDIMNSVAEIIDQHHLIALGKSPEPVELPNDEAQAALDSLVRAMEKLTAHFGGLDATWGDKFRVGRDDQSWPLGGGGGNRHGITTLRNVGYGQEREDRTRWGQSGQTSTQIVVMTQPVQSWTFVPIGQSDRPHSRHYDDQAEKLFSPGIMKETWWTPEALQPNIASRQLLAGAEAVAIVALEPAETPVAASPVAGVWTATLSFQGSSMPATLTLADEAGALSGTWKDQFGDDALENVKLEENTLSFNRQVLYDGTRYNIAFQGKLEGNTLKGAFSSDVGPLQVEATREAAPEPAPAPVPAPAPEPAPTPEATPEPAPADFSSVLGVWNLSMAFQGQEMPATLSLREEAGALQGSWKDSFGEDALEDVNLEGNALSFNRGVTYQGIEYDTSFQGTVDANALTGQFTTEVGQLDVAGTRVQEPETVPPAPESPTEAAPAPPGIAGTWDTTIEFQGSKRPSKLVLAQGEDGSFTATVEDEFGNTPPYDLTVDGQQLTFTRKVEYQGTTYVISFSGSVSGDTLEGTYDTDAGALPVKGTRSAKAETPEEESVENPAGAVVGTWEVTLDFQGQSFPATLTLDQAEDGVLSGTWKDQFSESPPKNIKVDGGTLTFDRTVEYQGQDYTIAFEGTLEGDLIKGQYNTDMGPLPLTARRLSPLAPADETAPDPAEAFFGNWDIVVDIQGNDLPATMSVKRSGEELKATWSDEYSSSEPYNVRVEDNALHFERKIDFQGDELVIVFKAELEGDELEGQYETDMGPLPLRGTRAAESPKADAEAGLPGTWEVTTVSQLGTVVRTLQISPDMSGWYGDGERRFPLRSLRHEGDTVTFEVTVEIQDTEIPLSFEGTLEGGALKGVFSSPYGNATLTGVKKEETASLASPEDTLHEVLQQVKMAFESGEMTVNLEEVEIEMEGDWATVRGIVASGPLGEIIVTLELQQQGGAWNIS